MSEKKYFDEWENRCYLFNAELGNYMMIDNIGVYQKRKADIEQINELGAKYIFSSMPIENKRVRAGTQERTTIFNTKQ